MNRIDIVLYLQSIQPSKVYSHLIQLYTLKTHKLYFILLHYFILQFHSKTHYDIMSLF